MEYYTSVKKNEVYLYILIFKTSSCITLTKQSTEQNKSYLYVRMWKY